MNPEEKPPENPEFQPTASTPDPAISGSSGEGKLLNVDIVAGNQIESDPAPDQANTEPVEAIAVETTDGDDQDDDSSPIMAEAVVESAPGDLAWKTPVPNTGNLENLPAKGGAIGSLVLGIWCVLGAFVTNWSIINGLIGLLMGLWGMASRKQKTALLGILLCVLGIFMSLIQFNELINTYFTATEEVTF